MNASELRLGNLVIDEDGDVLPIFLISNHSVFHNKELFSSIETISGVPITEEWLISMGCEKIKNNYGSYFKMKDYSLTQYEANGGFQITWCGMATLTKIYFVHQWQNLHFALIGEELIREH